MTSISCAIVGVPDQALSKYKLDFYDDALRRALPAIEQLMSDEVAWELFADLSVDQKLDIARSVYGKRLTDAQRQLFSA